MGGWSVGPGWGWLFMALLVVGAVLLVVVLVRVVAGGSRGAGTGRAAGGGGARRILDERYARGEIDTEEYQRRLRALKGG